MRRRVVARVAGLVGVLGMAAVLGHWLWTGTERGWASQSGQPAGQAFRLTVALERPWQRELQLTEGQTIELAVAVGAWKLVELRRQKLPHDVDGGSHLRPPGGATRPVDEGAQGW